MSSISGVKHFRQEEDYTCVAACLRMTLDYWGVQRSEQDIAAPTHTTITGTRLEESIAVVALGVEVIIDKATLTDLQRYLDEGKPCIVSVLSIHFLHYALLPAVLHAVVAVGMDADKIHIFDPARESAPDVIPIESFAAAWQGGRNRIVVINPRESKCH